MPGDIPGYYYDSEKKKYFKIEKSQTAPPSAAWSADSVKKRRVQVRAAETKRQRADLIKNHIKRHGMRRDVTALGLLSRQIEYRGVAEPGWGRPYNEDLGAAMWASGVVDKGCLPFAPSFVRARMAHMGCMYVGGAECGQETGLVYANMDEELIVGAPITTDNNENICLPPKVEGEDSTRRRLGTQMVYCSQVSSITYHKPSHKIMMTSREPNHGNAFYFFEPPLESSFDVQPYQMYDGSTNDEQMTTQLQFRGPWGVYQCTPAPASSDLLCVIGTNKGLLRVRSNDSIAWLSTHGQSQPSTHRRSRHNNTPREIFDQDFQNGNHNIVLAGGRQPRLWITDMRVPECEWRWIPHASSISHLRSVNPHQVLVAGLQNSMSLYDMRFFSRKPNGARPILEFPEYRNQAHFHIGWAVCPELNVVAAAHDDGMVKLFSLKTGRIVRSPGAQGLDRVSSETPIRAMMFQTLPGEKRPSLFFAEGPMLRKFGFATTGAGEDEE